MFYFNSIGIIITIVCFAILPLLYLTAIIAALILVLSNKRYTKKFMGDLLKDIEWEIIFFFISLYIIVGAMSQAGFTEIFSGIPFQLLDPAVLGIIILILVSLISGVVANTPTALIFIPIIQALINNFNFPEIPLLFAFIIAINLGGNLIPQGAAADMITLKVAQDSGVENLSYKRLLKTGAMFAVIHIGFSLLYLLALTYVIFFIIFIGCVISLIILILLPIFKK